MKRKVISQPRDTKTGAGKLAGLRVKEADFELNREQMYVIENFWDDTAHNDSVAFTKQEAEDLIEAIKEVTE